MNNYFDKNGKRIDLRNADELRPISAKLGVIENADGSCYLEWGQNKVIVAVYGPREMIPKHQADPYKGKIRYNYRMAPFSVTDRKNPKPGRREIEISKVSAEALSAAVMLEEYPMSAIDVYVTVLDSNAGTRIAALTASSLALAHAGIAMKDLVCGTAVGRAGSKLIVDLNKHEEDAPDAVDMAYAMIPKTKEVVLLQMDGVFTESEFKEALRLAEKSSLSVYDIQRNVLDDARRK